MFAGNAFLKNNELIKTLLARPILWYTKYKGDRCPIFASVATNSNFGVNEVRLWQVCNSWDAEKWTSDGCPILLADHLRLGPNMKEFLQDWNYWKWMRHFRVKGGLSFNRLKIWRRFIFGVGFERRLNVNGERSGQRLVYSVPHFN